MRDVRLRRHALCELERISRAVPTWRSAPTACSMWPANRISGSRARNVYAYSLETGDLVKSLPVPDSLSLSYFPVGLAFHPEGDLLVSEFHFGKILTFDIETDQYTGLFADLETSTFCDIDFGPDGNLYAAHTGGDRFLILDGQSGELLREIQGVNEPRQLAFSHAAVPAPSSLVCLLGLLASVASIGWWRQIRE